MTSSLDPTLALTEDKLVRAEYFEYITNKKFVKSERRICGEIPSHIFL